MSGVTPAALSEAELQVKAAEVSPALLRFLNELPFWTDYLKRAYATRFSQLYAPFETRIQAVFDQRETLSDALYRSRMDSILTEQTVAEDAELQCLTLAAMRADELGVCEIR